MISSTAASTGRLSSQIEADTTMPHENSGTRVRRMPGARSVNTVVITHTEASSSPAMTMMKARAQRSTPEGREPPGPPWMP